MLLGVTSSQPKASIEPSAQSGASESAVDSTIEATAFPITLTGIQGTSECAQLSYFLSKGSTYLSKKEYKKWCTLCTVFPLMSRP